MVNKFVFIGSYLNCSWNTKIKKGVAGSTTAAVVLCCWRVLFLLFFVIVVNCCVYYYWLCNEHSTHTHTPKKYDDDEVHADMYNSFFFFFWNVKWFTFAFHCRIFPVYLLFRTGTESYRRCILLVCVFVCVIRVHRVRFHIQYLFLLIYLINCFDVLVFYLTWHLITYVDKHMDRHTHIHTHALDAIFIYDTRGNKCLWNVLWFFWGCGFFFICVPYAHAIRLGTIEGRWRRLAPRHFSMFRINRLRLAVCGWYTGH